MVFIKDVGCGKSLIYRNNFWIVTGRLFSPTFRNDMKKLIRHSELDSESLFNK